MAGISLVASALRRSSLDLPRSSFVAKRCPVADGNRLVDDRRSTASGACSRPISPTRSGGLRERQRRRRSAARRASRSRRRALAMMITARIRRPDGATASRGRGFALATRHERSRSHRGVLLPLRGPATCARSARIGPSRSPRLRRAQTGSAAREAERRRRAVLLRPPLRVGESCRPHAAGSTQRTRLGEVDAVGNGASLFAVANESRGHPREA